MGQEPTLRDVVEKICAQRGVPGMAVGLLTEAGREIVTYGVASIETQCPVRRDTLFQIGSITKVFLTTVVMQLVEQGLAALNEPVAASVPEFQLADPRARDTITLRHLLTHTSGIEGDRFDDYGYGDDALRRYVASLAEARQIHAPGQHWSYCNSGFSVAGRLIEIKTGQTFETAMRERLFQRLGLERSFFFAQDILGYPFACGHRTRENGTVEVVRDFALPQTVHPAGGIWATIDDLLSFAAFHLGLLRLSDPPLSPEGVELMQKPQVAAGNWADAYGFGWAIWSVGNTRLIGHGGSTNGFQAHVVLLPEQRVAIASLTNHESGSAAIYELETWILAERFGIQVPNPRSVTVGEAELARLAGTYEYPLARVTVRPAAGGFWLETVQTRGLSREQHERHLPPLFLRPIGRSVFTAGPTRVVPNRVDFVFDKDSERPCWIRVFGRLAERVER